ncbi:MAG TPA: DUF885 domain-containing protein [Vitreimonas sp.]|uniref:DUF885 domain-containing protein n=1 Tax=Vitreimonas sp. TaxID=3069702 RepID=UPI002D48FAA4|nr:DUF885 domain-containing protein [Vitreimonas sp.]HYD87772.1 DUF885 domain-containing protein [Vitreimonas sp.]
MFDRRKLLLGGAGLIAGCAHAETSGAPDPAVDAQFRDAVDRMGQRSRRTRPFLLRQFDPARLTPDARVVYESLLPGAEADAAISQFPWGRSGAPYPVTHRNGMYRRAAEMRDEDRPSISAREVTNDTNRLDGHAARGVIAPGFLIDATIPAVEAAHQRVASDGGRGFEPLADALSRQIDKLRELRTRAPAEAGLWRLPRGEEYYRLVLQFQLGAPIDPREAHENALARCRALQAEAAVLLRAHGLTAGDVATRLRILAHDERHLFADSAEGKAQAVAFMNERLERVRALTAGLIEGAGETQAQVRLLPPAQEANGTMGRRQGGAYLVDLGNIRARPRWTLASVVHHELIPGHILQAPHERAVSPSQMQLRHSLGYAEGWSTYAEQIADEAGCFADDALSRIGYLQWMLFRMARVVADTGIHAMRWSRERAEQEMRALQGDSIAFVSIEEDVLRFVAQPGAYAAQGLAALHIADLRERTRRRTRSFDIVRFHNAMLRHGPLSPPGLEHAARVAFA